MADTQSYKVGALWNGETKTGKATVTGTFEFGGQKFRISLVPNPDKSKDPEDKQPDFLGVFAAFWKEKRPDKNYALSGKIGLDGDEKVSLLVFREGKTNPDGSARHEKAPNFTIKSLDNNLGNPARDGKAKGSGGGAQGSLDDDPPF